MAGLFSAFARFFLNSNHQSHTTLPPPESINPFHLPFKSPKSNHHANSSITKAIHNSPDMYTLQSTSLLLTKLPPELRNIIWTYILGDRRVHLVYEASEKLRGCVCGDQNVLPCTSAAHGGEGFADRKHWTGGNMPYRMKFEVRDKGWMGVLVACRASYFEASKILYSTSRFDLSDCWTQVSLLQWSIPLSSLSHISNITISILDLYLAPSVVDYPAWKSLWATLNLLNGLKGLKVEVVTKERCTRATMTSKDLAQIEEQLLGYLRALDDVPRSRKTKREIVFLSDEKGSDSDVAKELVERGWKITRD